MSSEITEQPEMRSIGVVDTMFARIDMGSIAEDHLESLDGYGTRFTTVRRTVPGFKDLAVAARQLIERDNCAIVIACGMPGGADIDQVCAHEASQGIMLAQVLTGTHILEVFVHTLEESDPAAFIKLCENRVRGHAQNAYWMLFDPGELRARAGQGMRQGSDDAGPINLDNAIGSLIALPHACVRFREAPATPSKHAGLSC